MAVVTTTEWTEAMRFPSALDAQWAASACRGWPARKVRAADGGLWVIELNPSLNPATRVWLKEL